MSRDFLLVLLQSLHEWHLLDPNLLEACLIELPDPRGRHAVELPERLVASVDGVVAILYLGSKLEFDYVGDLLRGKRFHLLLIIVSGKQFQSGEDLSARQSVPLVTSRRASHYSSIQRDDDHLVVFAGFGSPIFQWASSIYRSSC